MKQVQYITIRQRPEESTNLWFWPSNIKKSEKLFWPDFHNFLREKLRSACLQYLSELYLDSELTIKFSNSDGFCVERIEDGESKWHCVEFKNYHLEKDILVYTPPLISKVMLGKK